MLNRLPKSQAILQVYAVIAVMLSAWTITSFLWKLSAWLLVLNLGEILTVFSYAMVTNLIESLFVLLFLLLICILLPARYFRDKFAARGVIFSAGLLGSVMLYLKLYIIYGLGNAPGLLIYPLALLLVTAFLLLFSSRLPFVRAVESVLLWISDRLVVFLYILIPVYAIFLIYVLFRNIT